MNNVPELSQELSKILTALRAGGITPKEADTFANVAGKLLKANLGQLLYYNQRKVECPKLNFFEEPKPDDGTGSLFQGAV